MKYSPFNPKRGESAKIPMIITIGRSTLIEAIRLSGIKIPNDCDITFRTLSGGDCSSTDVPLLDEEQVTSVRYQV